MSNKFNKGSLWRKWDLHVHTPKSIVQHFGGDTEEAWEKYIQDLEALPEEFKVLGINDYIFIDGYKKILEYKDKGRLSNIDLILPVIELRLDKFASIDDKAWKKVNLHIIFSDKVNPETIEAQFINAIQHSIKLSPDIDGLDFKGIATREALKDIGQKIKNTSTVPISETNEKAGFNNIFFEYKAVKDALQSTYFKDKFLLAIGKTEWDTMRWTGSISVKKTLINEANFVFSALAKSEDYQKHVDSLNTQGVNSKLFDCSDAHFFSDSIDKDRIGNCSTWIKADTTFEGLKQVSNDRSRIFIGETPPLIDRVKLNPTKYIKNLTISKIGGSTLNEVWFDGLSIEFNSALVAVIGNKGNGKSAIADTLGLLGNTQNFDDFSFLTNSKFRKRKTNNKAEQFEARLEWVDGSVDTKILSTNPLTSDIERVKYIPQGFLEKLCNDDVDDFEKELRKVIFSHISESDRLGQSSLESLIDYKTEIINSEIGSIKKSLQEINDSIVELEVKKSTEYRTTLEQRLTEKKKEISAHNSVKPTKVDAPTDPAIIEANKIFQDEIAIKRESLKKIEGSIIQKQELQKELKVSISELDKTIQSVALFVSDFGELKRDINPVLIKRKIEISEIISINVNTKKLEDEKSNLSKELSQIEVDLGTGIENGFIFEQKKITTEISALKGKLDEPSKRYQKYIDDMKSWEEKNNSLQGSSTKENSYEFYTSQIKYIDENLSDDLSAKYIARKEKTMQLFSRKNQILILYKSLFNPITDFISEYGETVDSYNINLDVDYKLNGFVEKFFDHISLGAKGSFLGNPAGYERLNHILETHNLSTEEGISAFLDEIIENLQQDQRDNVNKEKREVYNQLKKGYTTNDLYSFLFSLEYLEPVYRLKLAEKNISELSPGERGALLLIFYLILDQDDIPLIIDQPEENLDNQSVFKILVHFIKTAKNKRQIIIVTHNPNLAVVCSAEQVIHVQIDKLNRNTVSCTSGSLENPDINNTVVDILEGTYPALNTRNATYDVIERIL